jgi:hypothetical protein
VEAEGAHKGDIRGVTSSYAFAACIMMLFVTIEKRIFNMLETNHVRNEVTLRETESRNANGSRGVDETRELRPSLTCLPVSSLLHIDNFSQNTRCAPATAHRQRHRTSRPHVVTRPRA